MDLNFLRSMLTFYNFMKKYLLCFSGSGDIWTSPVKQHCIKQ